MNKDLLDLSSLVEEIREVTGLPIIHGDVMRFNHVDGTYSVVHRNNPLDRNQVQALNAYTLAKLELTAHYQLVNALDEVRTRFNRVTNLIQSGDVPGSAIAGLNARVAAIGQAVDGMENEVGNATPKPNVLS